MKPINTDLVAANQVLRLIERTKAYAEDIIDEVPGIFIIFDGENRVLKCNNALRRLTGVSIERLIGFELEKLFSPANWEIFCQHVQQVRISPKAEVEFELPVDGDSIDPKVIFWRVSKIDVPNRAGESLLSAMGIDITRLRIAEKKMADLYNTLPVGILMIGESGHIEEVYTSYIERMLGRSDLTGEDFVSVFFDTQNHTFTEKQLKAISSFKQFFNISPVIFEMKTSSLPAQVKYKKPNVKMEQYLGLKFQEITHDGVVKKIMVLVDDRTAIVRQELERQAQRLEDEKNITRILQIKRLSKGMLPLVSKELAQSAGKFKGLVKERNLESLKRVLHGFKGNANVCGFTSIAEMTQLLEEELKMHEGKPTDWSWLDGKIDSMLKEWTETHAMIVALHPDLFSNKSDKKQEAVQKLFESYNQLMHLDRSAERDLKLERVSFQMSLYNFETAGNILELLQERCASTAKKLKKSAKLELQGGDVLLDNEAQGRLSEILLHLINNSLAHGIEESEVRKSRGKNPDGLIKIQLAEGDGKLLLTYEDDGAGIDFEKVRKLAVERRLATLDEAVRMTKDQLVQIILSPGFSTMSEADMIAGRGIGMDAVVALIKDKGGFFTVESEQGKGFHFNFSWPLARQPVRRKLTLISEVVGSIRDAIDIELGSHFDMTLNIKPGLLVVDTPKLALAISSVVKVGLKNLKSGQRPILDLKIDDRGRCVLSIDQLTDPGVWDQDLEFKAIECFYREILAAHEGGFRVNEGRLEISFGPFFDGAIIPELNVSVDSGLTFQEVEALRTRISGFLSGAGIRYSYRPNDKASADGASALRIAKTESESLNVISSELSDDLLKRKVFDVIGKNIGIT